MASVEDHPVQILSYNKQKRNFELNSTELESILNSPDVRDANIAVVSIAGGFRKGRSFMLNFFLRYLNETYIHQREDWLGSDDTQLSGFAWRGGSERHTTGLWVWSKVFTKVLPGGEKIGVMLMDTQGTFDSNSTMRDNVTIFSLSTMLSSIQIYNLFNNIQEDDLQHLQLFTEYGKLVLEQTDEKAFQMLLFLVRDWSFPYEAAYGFAGGREILEQKLKVTEDPLDDSQAYVRTHLKSCYEKLDCFLMPYPGRNATISRSFSGQLKDIDPEFNAMLKEFVPALLAPQNVLSKKISGAKLNGRTLLTYIQSYWNIFSKGGVLTAQTIFGATSEANNLTAKEEATEFYHSEMGKATGAILEIGEMVELHNNIKKQSLELFRTKAVMGGEGMKTGYYNKLNDSLQNYLVLYLLQIEDNKAKRLKSQIEKYRKSSDAEIISQMEEYRKSSEAEKIRLQQEIENLRRELASKGSGSGGGGGCTILQSAQVPNALTIKTVVIKFYFMFLFSSSFWQSVFLVTKSNRQTPKYRRIFECYI